MLLRFQQIAIRNPSLFLAIPPLQPRFFSTRSLLLRRKVQLVYNIDKTKPIWPQLKTKSVQRELIRAYFRYFFLLLGGSAFIFGGISAYYMFNLRRKYWVPSEWSYLSQIYFRDGQDGMYAEEASIEADWLKVAGANLNVLARLEDPKIDGKDIVPVLGEEDGEILVEGVGKTGLDISAKSTAWKDGYFTTIFSLAKAAERLENFLEIVKTGDRVHKDYVTSPENPIPKPAPNGAPNLDISECRPYLDTPQAYYLKIITTKGFSSAQRLEAALACADWFGFDELYDSSENMLSWAHDIATENVGIEAKDAISKDRGVIRDNAPTVTQNIFNLADGYGRHHLRKGDYNSSLNVYGSILKAHRSLPIPEPDTNIPITPKGPASAMGSVTEFLAAAPQPVHIDGDAKLYHLPSTKCSEAATMTHIGEILFASSLADPGGPIANPVKPTSPSLLSRLLFFNSAPSSTDTPSNPIALTKAQEAGLSWTRNAFNTSEESLNLLASLPWDPALDVYVLDLRSPLVAATLSHLNLLPSSPSAAKPLIMPEESILDARRKCATCLAVALDNWTSMLARLEEQELEAWKAGREERVKGKTEPNLEKEKDKEKEETFKSSWAEEIETLKEKGGMAKRLIRSEGIML